MLLFLLFLPVLALSAIVALCRWRTPRLPLKVLKYLGLIGASIAIAFSLTVSWAIFVPSKEVSYSVDIPGYRVEFYEGAGHMTFDVPRYFNVYRPDGKKAQFLIDVDANSCRDIKTETKQQRIYFYCKGEPLDETSYVDTEALTVYSGWAKDEQAIADLEFVEQPSQE